MAHFRGLPTVAQALLLTAAFAVVAAVLGAGALLAFFAWDDHQFENGPYCHAHPGDPLC